MIPCTSSSFFAPILISFSTTTFNIPHSLASNYDVCILIWAIKILIFSCLPLFQIEIENCLCFSISSTILVIFIPLTMLFLSLCLVLYAYWKRKNINDDSNLNNKNHYDNDEGIVRFVIILIVHLHNLTILFYLSIAFLRIENCIIFYFLIWKSSKVIQCERKSMLESRFLLKFSLCVYNFHAWMKNEVVIKNVTFLRCRWHSPYLNSLNFMLFYEVLFA